LRSAITAERATPLPLHVRAVCIGNARRQAAPLSMLKGEGLASLSGGRQS